MIHLINSLLSISLITLVTSLASTGAKADWPAEARDLYCEGWLATMPGVTIRAHIFVEPNIVLVELGGTHRRQTVLVNAETYVIQKSVEDPNIASEFFQFNFPSGRLAIPALSQNESFAGNLMLRGPAVEGFGIPTRKSFKVMVQCRELSDQALFHD